jgi:alpha-1,3-glucosyltransferase
MAAAARPFAHVAAHIGLAAAALKLLLAPSAHSTDLEVHRWWMALTRDRPPAAWYTDTASIWTLDYPPLFAYFERGLAWAAAVVHPAMVDPAHHGYDAPAALLFMRVSVVATDLLLVFAVYRFVCAAHAAAGVLERARQKFSSGGENGRLVDLRPAAAALILFNPGLFLVDNVHFQYNGLILGFLLLSLASLMNGKLRVGAFWFTVAIHLKHTLLPVAPCIAVYMLHSVYLSATSNSLFGAFIETAGIALNILTVLALSWAPLLYSGGLAAVEACFARLLPFDRGLLHAYWAPNWWALYSFADKLAVASGCSLREPDMDISSGHIGAMRPFRCLPNVSPEVTAGLVLGSIVPVALALAVSRPGSSLHDSALEHSRARRALFLPQAVAFSSLSAFMFGWHVHEKMILLATVPLGGVALFASRAAARGNVAYSYALLSLCGHFALHPLVTSPADTGYKLLHFAAYTMFAIPALFTYALTPCRNFSCRGWRALVGLFIVGCIVVEWYAGAGGCHIWLFGAHRLQFLPLMAVSVFSAAGVLTAYISLLLSFLWD